MKRAAIASFCFLVLVSARPSAFAQSKDLRTVTIDGCKLDYEDVNLSFDRKQYEAQWASTGTEYDILWSSTSACTKQNFHVPAPGTAPPNPPANVSDKCDVDPNIHKPNPFPYKMTYQDTQGKKHTCKTSGRVVVNDGQAVGLTRHRRVASKGHPPQANVGTARHLLTTQLSHDRLVNIDEACMPSATPNLYIDDKTTLVWAAENPKPGVKFTIKFRFFSPCSDTETPPQNPVLEYEVTSGPGSRSSVCHVNTSYLPITYLYDIQVGDGSSTCPYLGLVNVR